MIYALLSRRFVDRVSSTDTNRTRLVRKARPAESFFNFFTPPVPPTQEAIDNDEIDEDILDELDEKLEMDYQLGEDIKEKIIPKAVDYFTGKALEYDMMDEDDEDYEDIDDDDDDDDLDDVSTSPRSFRYPRLTIRRTLNQTTPPPRQRRVERVRVQDKGVRTLKSANSSKRLELGLHLFLPVWHVLSSAHLLVVQSLCPSPVRCVFVVSRAFVVLTMRFSLFPSHIFALFALTPSHGAWRESPVPLPVLFQPAVVVPDISKINLMYSLMPSAASNFLAPCSSRDFFL